MLNVTNAAHSTRIRLAETAADIADHLLAGVFEVVVAILIGATIIAGGFGLLLNHYGVHIGGFEYVLGYALGLPITAKGICWLLDRI